MEQKVLTICKYKSNAVFQLFQFKTTIVFTFVDMLNNLATDLEASKVRHNKFWNHLFHKNKLPFSCIISRSLW